MEEGEYNRLQGEYPSVERDVVLMSTSSYSSSLMA